MNRRNCPECESDHLIISEQGSLVCHECGNQISAVVQICSRCDHVNEPAAGVCANCAEPLNVVDRVLSRQTIAGKPPWLEKARKQAHRIKEHEAASSQQRFEKFIEEDRLREEELRKAQERQDRQEQRTLSATIIFTALALVIIVVAALIFALQG